MASISTFYGQTDGTVLATISIRVPADIIKHIELSACRSDEDVFRELCGLLYGKVWVNDGWYKKD